MACAAWVGSVFTWRRASGEGETGRAGAASKKTSFASLAQSTLCLGSVMAPGRFARGMAERLQRNTPRLIYVAGRPWRLFGANLRHHHSNDAISDCHKRVIVPLVCVYFTFMTNDVHLEYTSRLS